MQILEYIDKYKVPHKNLDEFSIELDLDEDKWVITPSSNKAVNKSSGSIHFIKMKEFAEWKIGQSIEYPTNYRKIWTEADTKELKSLIEGGCTYREIAQQIGRVAGDIVPMCYRVQGVASEVGSDIDLDSKPNELELGLKESEEDIEVTV